MWIIIYSEFSFSLSSYTFDKRSPFPIEVPMTYTIFPQFLLDFETGHIV